MLRIHGRKIEHLRVLSKVGIVSFAGIVSCGLVILTLGIMLFPSLPPTAQAEENGDTADSDSTQSIGISIPADLTLDVTPTQEGSFVSGDLEILISTDNATGYTLAFSLSGTDTSLSSSIEKIGSEIPSTAATIDEPTTLPVNTWGWYPDSIANNTDNFFIALPNSADPYQLKETSAPTQSSGETTTISFGVNIDTSVPSGSYSNTIVISAIANYTPKPVLDVYPTTGWAGDAITLYSNGGFVDVESVSIGGTACTNFDVKSVDELTCELPEKAETDTTSGSDNGYEITIIASGYQLDTHNFTVRYFNPNRTETASVSNAQVTNVSMETFTVSDCGRLGVGDIISLTDGRNGQTYRIKKMQDGKCWMIDNMKYKGEGITIANIGDGTEGIALGKDKLNTIDGSSNASSTGAGTNFDKAFFDSPMGIGYCYDSSLQGSYTKCGYLYNWYAATAGTGAYGAGAQGSNATASICPTGWRLPSGGENANSDLAILNSSMANNTFTSPGFYDETIDYTYARGWQYSGDWSGVMSGGQSGSLFFQGQNGFYWTSTFGTTGSARVLYFHSYGIGAGAGSNEMYYGFALRCVMNGSVNIAFDGNGADSGSMALQSIGVGQSDSLSANEFTRDGYRFMGWNTEADGSGTFYVNGETYTALTSQAGQTVTLYAQWKQIYYMQDFTNAQCQSLASDSNFTVVDKRDGNDYTVRYINGACWMTQNLRIAGGTTVTSADSNVSSNYTIPTTDLTAGASYIEGRVHNSGNTLDGYWYNYCAVSAGTVCSENNQDALHDICPKNWRMPTLTEQQNILGDYSSIFLPTNSGYYGYNGLFDEDGTLWWSSTTYAMSFVYAQYCMWYSDNGLLTSYMDRDLGGNIRCIRSS